MEDKFRMKIYMENKQKVARHNAKAAQGHYSYHLKMNKYGDMVSRNLDNRRTAFS